MKQRTKHREEKQNNIGGIRLFRRRIYNELGCANRQIPIVQ